MAADDPCEKAPIWLQDQLTRLPPPPLRDGGVFWPRAVTLVIACGIAASLLYYFSVATSPPEHQIDVAAGAPPASPIASGPPTQHSTEARDELRIGSTAGPVLAPAEARAPAPEQIVQTAATKRPPPDSPSRSSAGAAVAKPPAAQGPVTEVSVTEAPVIEALAVPAEPVPLPPARPPQVEVAQAQITPPPATPALAEDKSSPSPEPTSVPATKPADFQDLKLLTHRGKQFFDSGDLVAARILFARAANAGDATAALAMGATYDPVVLSERGVRGVVADIDKARHWYERAKEMGSPEGPRR